MPFLDTSDVLLDPDFCDRTLVCERNALSTNDSGRGVLSIEKLPFFAVVTSSTGEQLQRGAVGEHAADTIMVITRFKLRSAGPGATADIVAWNGQRYTVINVNDYSTYGIGFTENKCEMIPLAG